MSAFASVAIAPGVGSKRWAVSHLYTGMKETYASVRLEQGSVEWWSAGKTYRSDPGAILLKQPGDVHRDLARTGTGIFQIIVFAPHLVEIADHVQPHLDAGDPRGAVFHRLHDAVDAGVEGLALEVMTTEAIVAFSSLGNATLDLTRPVRRAIEMLRAQLSEVIKLDDLAAHAGLDKFHLCRAFRTQIGIPPHAYLTRLRIMRAKELLSAGVRPSEIAPQVGLYDQSQLNRHFRRLVGTTPGQYVGSSAC